MTADVVIRRLLVADWHGVCPPRKRAAATYLPSRVWPCRQMDRSINQVNRLAGGALRRCNRSMPNQLG